MLELFALTVIVLISAWAWRNLVRPGLRYVQVRRDLARGVLTLHPCEVTDGEESVRGSIRKLSQSEANVYRQFGTHASRLFAVFKYGTDTGIRICETNLLHRGPETVSFWPYSYAAFDVRRPGMFFDNSYPFNESRTSEEFAGLVLRRDDRWKLRTSEGNAL